MNTTSLDSILSLQQYREQNRQRGWRATADLIAQHILDKTGSVNLRDIDRKVILSRWRDDEIKPSATEKVINKQIKEFARRLEEAMLVLLYSFDDDPEACAAAMAHLVYHWRVFDFERYRVASIAILDIHLTASPVWHHWESVVGASPRDVEPAVDSRFH
jgi:phosphoribosyl-ATP pyrophosphohydrolase